MYVMKRTIVLMLMSLVVGGAFLGGSRYNRAAAVQPVSGISSGRAETPGRPMAAAGLAGRVGVDAEKQQILGVHSTPVEQVSGTRTLRVFGRVAPDETRVYKVNAGIDGFIRDVSSVTTGSQVEKDQWLASFSAPAALTTIQLYILNLGSVDRLKQAAASGSVEAQAAPAGAANVQQRVDQLQQIGMLVLQMDEIARTRQLPESIRMLAPAGGFVLMRNVSPGQKFERGAEFFRIADLRSVWIVADVFGAEARDLRPGAHAVVSLPDRREKLSARVAEVLPQFDPSTRTLKVRLEAENPGFVLRPDMFVDVEVPVTFPPTIAVPVDAVIDSGLITTVFVERGDGFFEPRRVETGWRSGDRVEIVKGLAPGERIVVEGAFLLDSESRMRAAPGAIAHAGHDHAHETTGHSEHDRAHQATEHSEHAGHTEHTGHGQ
jgi:membrane fusion protein, copper/silver efflux system